MEPEILSVLLWTAPLKNDAHFGELGQEWTWFSCLEDHVYLLTYNDRELGSDELNRFRLQLCDPGSTLASNLRALSQISQGSTCSLRCTSCIIAPPRNDIPHQVVGVALEGTSSPMPPELSRELHLHVVEPRRQDRMASHCASDS